MIQKTKDKESGIAHVAVILAAVIVLAVAAFGGWYVWQKNNEESIADKSNQQTTQNQEQQNTDPEDGKYLAISEWGVQIPLSDEISGAYYKLEKDGLEEHVYLYDANFDQMINSNGISCGGSNKYNFYAISRISSDDVSTLEAHEISRYKRFDFINNYQFKTTKNKAIINCLYSNPNGPYEEEFIDQNILKEASEKETALEASIKNISKLN